MSPEVLLALRSVGVALAAAPAAYLGIALWAVLRRAARAVASPSVWPAVSVLKPLCGVETGTYDCLRSFCTQTYSRYEIVFGVQDPADPVLAIVERLIREFPALRLRIVADRRQHGANRKVSNLINLLGAAEHDYLVLADSDIRVGPCYLDGVIAPLLDPRVGVVTTAYRAVARPGLASWLAATFVNDWFYPSVQVAAAFGSREFAFGATIALRRDALAAIGGFEAIADQLADDYALGEETRRIGLGTVLATVEVETLVEERSLRESLRHLLRWLRTIRAVRPAGYAASLVTFGVPVAALGTALSQGAPLAGTALGIAALARLVLHWRVRGRETPWWDWLALPLGDLLSLALWCWGFAARSVRWRGDRYRLAGDGAFQRYEDSTR